MDSSSSGGSAVLSTVPDLCSPNVLQTLLNDVRRSTASPEEKNHIRSLVLEFIQSGGSQEILHEIEELIETAGIVPRLETAQQASPAAASGQQLSTGQRTAVLGGARPQPAFGTETNRSPQNSAAPAVPAANSPAAKAATPAARQLVVKQAASVPPAPEALDTSALETETVPAEGAPAAAESRAVLTPSVSSSAEPDVPPVEPEPQPSASAPAPYAGDPNERVKEIKHLVNSRVGNPVNLIDANNEVGREYMNALLDAMKKINAAETSKIPEAMQRLEAAYSAVDKVLADPATNIGKAEAPPAGKPATAAADVAPSFTPPAHNPKPPRPAPAVRHAENAVPQQPAPEPALRERSGTTAARANPLTPAAPAGATSATSKLHSLAEAPDPLAAPVTAAKQRDAEPANPLMRSEVTAGLEQLLSEWKLFKSSGIFGTGPGGQDHPLYRQLAPLSMAVVISGRFEGSTPEIRQSITDYMNGWRYEQGIVHELQETFEHYLRRVIATILDKQPKSKNLQ